MKNYLRTHPGLTVFFTSLFLLMPAWFTFFSGDDFYIMKISQIHNIEDILHFFAFYQPSREFLFYRPLTAQFFFSTFQHFFGLHPWPYHLFGFFLFAIIIYFVYQLCLRLTNDKKVALIVTCFYAWSSSNLTRLSWITQIQELGLGVFFFGSVFSYLRYLSQPKLKYYLFSLIFFFGALASKESAVILPLVLGTCLVYSKKLSKDNLYRLIPFLILLFIYLYLRIYQMGFALGEHYFSDFSPKKILNTVFWYLLWSLSIPQLLVDYIGSGLRVNSRLFSYYGTYIIPIFSLFFLFFLSIIISLKKNMKELLRKPSLIIIIFGIIWFVAGLLPHLFSPFHKFAYELTVPLFGIALVLGILFRRNYKLPLLIFLFLSIITNLLTIQTHWSFTRGEVTRKVIKFISVKYPQYSQPFYFYNDKPATNPIWGYSRQIDQALYGSSALQVYYQNPYLKTYYEDDVKPPLGVAVIKLPSSRFLE